MDSPAVVKTYCLFCVSGQERNVTSRLRQYGYAPISPQVERWKPGQNTVRKVMCSLLPGYVFFDADAEPDWASVRTIASVLRILQYDDGERAMRGADEEFVAWLKRHAGVIRISHVVQVGTRIEFVDGPLRDMEGQVIKVNKNRRQVQLSIGGAQSLMRTVWCSIEYIEANTHLENTARV